MWKLQLVLNKQHQGLCFSQKLTVDDNGCLLFINLLTWQLSNRFNYNCAVKHAKYGDLMIIFLYKCLTLVLKVFLSDSYCHLNIVMFFRAFELTDTFVYPMFLYFTSNLFYTNSAGSLSVCYSSSSF